MNEMCEILFDGWTKLEADGTDSYYRPYGTKMMCVSRDGTHAPYPWVYGICDHVPVDAWVIQGRCSTKQEAMAACHFACKS
jgi:hypothetical protein